jgi:ABC-type transporter Mla MlaB component
MDALTPPSETSAVVFVLEGPIERSDIARLCERVRLLLARSNAKLVVCDVRALTKPDAATIDALARLQLTARRLGSQVRLRHACGALQDLLALVGLSEVVPLSPASRLEPRGQAEQRE